MNKEKAGKFMISYKEFGIELIEQVKEIFLKEGWAAYLNCDEALAASFRNSLHILGAFDGNELVGFIRCVGDGVHIVVIQDLIVDKAYQKRGIGTALFKATWDKYINVRMFQVNTDSDNEIANNFYKSFGMKLLADGNMVSYFR